jgi:DNA-binding transcriptional MerR regulator
MEMRVEQLSARSDLSVDTIRYYQSKGLLDPPRREGRVAWYGDQHLARLERIRSLRERGFTLATIGRLVSGELDAADEALIGELARAGAGGGPPGPDDHPPASILPVDDVDDDMVTIDELAEATGVPLALLRAVEAEGLLIPQRIDGQDRYSGEDVAAARAGLLLLEWGIPLSALLDLARRHHQATEAVAHEAVSLFSEYVRRPLRQESLMAGIPDGTDGTPTASAQAERLVQAYAELLPAVTTLVQVHFARTLVQAALDHVEKVGSDAERQAVVQQTGVLTDIDTRPAS